VSQKQATIYS